MQLRRELLQGQRPEAREVELCALRIGCPEWRCAQLAGLRPLHENLEDTIRGKRLVVRSVKSHSLHGARGTHRLSNLREPTVHPTQVSSDLTHVLGKFAEGPALFAIDAKLFATRIVPGGKLWTRAIRLTFRLHLWKRVSMYWTRVRFELDFGFGVNERVR